MAVKWQKCCEGNKSIILRKQHFCLWYWTCLIKWGYNYVYVVPNISIGTKPICSLITAQKMIKLNSPPRATGWRRVIIIYKYLFVRNDWDGQKSLCLRLINLRILPSYLLLLFRINWICHVWKTVTARNFKILLIIF